MPALTSGTRLGPYEILDALGAGGMGEVYRGRDTRLDRIVAIKVLAPGLAKDVTSRERFEREARAISSLKHPNICVLHDIGREKPSGSEDAPVDFLVMEYLEGETLSARLARGPSRAARSGGTSTPATPPPPMTVEEALAIAIPIAAALDCAHRQGIVHRDLKPGNVMLSNGTVKLLDFGLARLSQTNTGPDGKDGMGHGMVSLADLSLPTVSSPLTVKGTILGTLQYMAPEQLEGKAVDARADIFAFGGTLYEMLTGRRPFEGKSQASLIGAILDHEPPPVTTYQPVSPPILDEIVSRCLAKDPDERWQSARDLRRQLEWVTKSSADRSAIAAVGASAHRSGGRWTAIGAGVLAGAVITAAVTVGVLRPQPAPPSIKTRFAVSLPEGQQFTRAGRHVFALSPAGTHLAYIANQQLYLRSMQELNAAPILGTEGTDPSEPVFSPDGQWIAFWSRDELKKIPVTGGTPITLARAQNPFGASWTGDRILLGQASSGIVEISANGGAPKVLVAAKIDERMQSPQLVADGRAVLFSFRVGLLEQAGPTKWDEAAIVVQDLATGERKTLVRGGTDARLLPTGHLAYVRGATLFGVAIDARTLAVSSEAVPLQHGIQQAGAGASGAAQWAWSERGSLAFVAGEGVSTMRTLVWVSRDGQVEASSAPAHQINFAAAAMRISPDGTRVALAVDSDDTSGSSNASATTASSDIWIWEMRRNTVTRLSLSGKAVSPVWTPDSERVCYRSGTEILCQFANGSGQVQTLTQVPELANLKSFSPDGLRLVSTANVDPNQDLVMTTIGSTIETRPLLRTRFSEAGGAISPDGKWIAFQSNESGRSEVYVRPFPNVEAGRWPVSTEGGFEPRWAKNGRELFYVTGGGQAPRLLWSVAIAAGATFNAEKPIPLTKLTGPTSAAYDVGADGRFLFHVPATNVAAATQLSQIVVVENWFDELRARVPIGQK